MGSSGIPINIGSYCSDFVIEDPSPQTFVGCFRRIDSNTNRIYYLILDQSSGFQEVEHPIIQPNPGRAYILDDFQLSVHWDRTIKPVVENRVITPQNTLRYVSSNSRPTPLASNIIKFESDSITLRTAANPATTRGVLSLFPFSSVSSGQYTVTYDSAECPYTLEKGPLVYLVNDADDNKSIVTATTQKRYLIIAPPNPITIGYLDLFKPEVTESMVKQTMYRINKQTSLVNQSIRYSFDVFRENTQGNTPTERSYNTYREIGLTFPEFTIDANEVLGSTNDGFKDTKITHTMPDGFIVKYVATPEVMDKTLADLYGELSLGLFKLWDSTHNLDTNMYLGYDCNTPGLTCAGNRQLVIREYFNYLKPSASCQFRMYDLGNNEYMILVTDPFSNPPARYIMRPSSNGTLRFVPTSSLTKEERGWHLEPVNNPVQGDNSRLVRLRWNYPESPLPGAAVGTPGIYISVTNNVVAASLQSSASTFVCIRCTRINEETGTCASNQPMYVDEDLDYLSSPVPVSPTAINVARTTATAIESNLRFSRTSDGQLMQVTDDGSVSFVNDGTESTFFTTRAGIITYEEQRVPKNYVFVAKQTESGGEYIYAKYVAGSPPNLKFVAATNPNVADGFGWIIDGDTIAVAPTTSPAPRSPQTIGLTILRHFRASFGSYDVENDEYTVTFNSNKNFSSITQGAGGILRSITWSATTGSALVRATAPRSPVTSPPSFPQNTKSFTVSATFDDGTNSSLNLIVPEPPKPVITQTAQIIDVGSYAVGITSLVISNMNSSATVTARLQAIGSPGSASPSFQAGGSLTYGDFSLPSGFTISGLTPNTRYSAPSFTIVNSRNQNPISFTMPNNFTTSPVPATTPSGGGGGGGGTSTDPFRLSGTVSNSNIQAIQLSKDARTGYINFTPKQNPEFTQNCTGRVNISSNREFDVDKALKFLDADSNIVAVVTKRYDAACYLEVRFYRLSGGVYTVDTSYPSGDVSINTTDARIQHGSI